MSSWFGRAVVMTEGHEGALRRAGRNVLDVGGGGGWTGGMTTSQEVPQEELLPATRRALLHRIAVGQAEGRAPSLVAAVVRGGRTVWHGSRTSVEGHGPDENTQYRIGSLTKTFTAVLILRLRDEGRLDLSDPLEKHLPGTGAGRPRSRSCSRMPPGSPPSHPRPGGSAPRAHCDRNWPMSSGPNHCGTRSAAGSTTPTRATPCWARWSSGCVRLPGRTSSGVRCSYLSACTAPAAVHGRRTRAAGPSIPGRT